VERVCKGVLRVEPPEEDVVVAVEDPHLVTRKVELYFLHDGAVAWKGKDSLLNGFEVVVAHTVNILLLSNTEVLQGRMRGNCLEFFIDWHLIHPWSIVIVRDKEDVFVVIFLKEMLAAVF
jgi:hypothetical protein